MTATAATGLDRLRATLDALAEPGGSVGLWWRDDDLERPTPALGALLEELAGHGIVPALAAVSGRVESAAVAALAGTPARLFVHGWMHANHARPDDKKSEFGPERSLDVRLAEVADGRRRLSVMAGDRALACFVPPWNRIGDDLLHRLGAAGIVAVSGFAPWGRAASAAGVPRLDTHVDLIDWRSDRTPLPTEAVAAALEDRISTRLATARHETRVDAPIGILSHHLVTDAAAWRLWRPLLVALASHPAVRWLDPAAALADAGAETGTTPEGEKRRMG